MATNLTRKPFKLTSEDRQTKKGVVVGNLEELILKARIIFNLGPENIQICIERDGTEIVEDEFLQFLENFTDLLVVQGKCNQTGCQISNVSMEQQHGGSSEKTETVSAENTTAHYVVLNDVAPCTINGTEKEPNFEVISGGTDKGRDLLLDDMGYRYGIKAKSTRSVIWHCTARPGKLSTANSVDCRATVRQSNNIFSFGKVPHCCKRSPELNSAIRIRREIKERIDQGEAVVAEDAVRIVKEVMDKYRERNVKVPAKSDLIRIGYRRLKKFREAHDPS